MARKTVLVAGASGLVGYAALKAFAKAPDTDVDRARAPAARLISMCGTSRWI